MFLSSKIVIPLVDISHHATLFGLLSDISTIPYQRTVVWPAQHADQL